MTWDVNTSHCPYDPDGPFGLVIAKLCSLDGVTQEDIDALEDMAHAWAKAQRELNWRDMCKD